MLEPDLNTSIKINANDYIFWGPSYSENQSEHVKLDTFCVTTLIKYIATPECLCVCVCVCVCVCDANKICFKNIIFYIIGTVRSNFYFEVLCGIHNTFLY